MHSYGRDFSHVGKVHLVLAASAAGVYLLVLLLVGALQERNPNLAILSGIHVGPFITLTIFGILEYAFDRWGWRILCAIPACNVFDFSGKYSGKIIAGDKNEHPASIEIKQTWSKIEVCFDSGAAKANSFSASIVRDRIRNGHVELIYNYFARGGRSESGGRFDHYGTAVLARVMPSGKLEGDYYTEQDRDSFGSIIVDRVEE